MFNIKKHGEAESMRHSKLLKDILGVKTYSQLNILNMLNSPFDLSQTFFFVILVINIFIQPFWISYRSPPFAIRRPLGLL